jgi:putative glutamine amidotransferase
MPQRATIHTWAMRERSVGHPYTAGMRPSIGIPPCVDDRGRWRTGCTYLYLDGAYVRAVDAAGGRAVVLPMQADVDALVEGIDGLLLPGGDDFLPAEPYPEPVEFDPVCEPQVEFDRALLKAALRRGRPILGICYGMQLLALEHGGRLHHHLPLDLPGSAPHNLPEADGRHTIDIEPDTRLAEIFGTKGGTLRVNSLHHQGVAEPGRDMRVSARSPDGVIEAIEHVRAPFLIGLQWHPEKLEGEDGLLPVRALVAACRGR